MVSITDKEFDRILPNFEQKVIHLETRDAYGTAIELPTWLNGQPVSLMT